MDRSEEATESVNPREQELLASEPSVSNVPNEPMEALLRILQDMARVLICVAVGVPESTKFITLNSSYCRSIATAV